MRPKSCIKDNIVQPLIFLLRKLHAREENVLSWSHMTQGNLAKLKVESTFGTLPPAPISMSTFIGDVLQPYLSSLCDLCFTSHYI